MTASAATHINAQTTAVAPAVERPASAAILTTLALAEIGWVGALAYVLFRFVL